MTAIVTFISPFLVHWLTDYFKNHALSSDASKELIRFLCVVLSALAAILTVWVSGGSIDANLVNEVLLAFLNFLGATGIYHLRSN